LIPPRILFALIFLVLLAAHLCHTSILWEGDTLPLATAQQMLHGRTIYRDIWFDKPPLTAATYLLWGARAGWVLRTAGALYALLACWLIYRFARDLWGEPSAQWAAALLAFFLIFDLPSGVIPLASDLLMLAPHIAAVWMAATRQPFWSGVLAGIAFWINPKGVFVAAACLLWNPAGVAWLAAGFAATSTAAITTLWTAGALGPYWEEVWQWGRLYAGNTFIEHPLRDGALRTLNWMGFHIAAVLCWITIPKQRRFVWIGWLALSLVGVAAGLRFFPRYYFLLLPATVLLAAHAVVRFPRLRTAILILLLIPAIRFAPTYARALRDPNWSDTAMDRDSRNAAAAIRRIAKPGDTLFVWGYRPELYVYTGLPAATTYLDSQPLTGVPADRHLTQSEPVETDASARRRAELTHSHPTIIVDGLGPYNPRLAITQYPDLRQWLSQYPRRSSSGYAILYSAENR
jgi:hypothetical protein